MNIRFVLVLAVLGALGVLNGCRAATVQSYETCLYDSDCQVASDRCIELLSASSGNRVHLCSSGCTLASPSCPADRYGTGGRCISFNSGSTFNCYQSCSPSSSLCEYGTVCTAEDATTNVCFPPATTSSTVPAYSGCAAGMICQAGTSCILVKDRTDLDLCTVTHCTSDANCPRDRRGGNGLCISLDGDSFGTCVERCNSTSDCTYGLMGAEACVTRTNMGVPLPVRACLPN